MVFDDEAERKRELAAERARVQAERMKQVCSGGGGRCSRGRGNRAGLPASCAGCRFMGR
jgi:hypothetical protein